MARPLAQGDPHVAASWEIGGLLALILIYALADNPTDAAVISVLNVTGPLFFLGLLMLGAVRMVRLNVNCVWSSLFWFRVSTATYFGFGSFAPSIMNDATRLYVEDYFFFDIFHIMKLNEIVAVSALIVVITGALPVQLWRRRVAARALPGPDGQLLLIGLAFAIVGFSIELFVLLPFTLGVSEDEVVSGVVVALGQMAPVSLYLLTRYSVTYRPAWLPILMLALLVDMGVGVLQFNKSAVLLPLIMFLLAYLSRGFSAWRMFTTASAVLLTLGVIVPITDYGRAKLIEHDNPVAGLSERAQMLEKYFVESAPLQVDQPVEGVYARISYVNAASFAIDLYDRGYAGHSLDNALIVLMPRALWPDKPIISDIGREFNALATQNDNSFSAPGIFAEAYWCYGWGGVVLLMSAIGLLFSGLSRFAVNAIQERRWLQFPTVMLGMRMGFRVDGFIVVDIIGATGMLAVGYIVISIVERVVKAGLGSRAPRRTP